MSEQTQRWLFIAVLAAAVLAAAAWYAIGPPAALVPARDPLSKDVSEVMGALDSTTSMLPRTMVFPLASLSASGMPGLYDSLLAIAQSNRVLHIDIDSTWVEGRVTWVSRDAFSLSDYIGGRIEHAADGSERYVPLPNWEPPAQGPTTGYR